VTELNQTGIFTSPLDLFGIKDQPKKYLASLSSGNLISVFGLAKSDTGSDALNPLTRTSLSKDGKYYLLNGSKQLI
jgi:alkylation response protein AidB-like acyl-CoA dehydrogenase